MKNCISITVLSLLLAFCIPAASQSSNDAAKINAWKKSLGGTIVVSGDVCDLLNGYGTGPFDPTQCWNKQLLELGNLQPKAAGNKDITAILQQEKNRLQEYLETYRALSPKEKEKRDNIFEGLIKAVRQSNNNVKTGLGQVVNSSSYNTNQKEAAKQILKKTGTKGCIVPDCVCVIAEGCPCCGYDTITKEVYGTKIVLR